MSVSSALPASMFEQFSQLAKPCPLDRVLQYRLVLSCLTRICTSLYPRQPQGNSILSAYYYTQIQTTPSLMISEIYRLIYVIGTLILYHSHIKLVLLRRVSEESGLDNRTILLYVLKRRSP